MSRFDRGPQQGAPAPARRAVCAGLAAIYAAPARAAAPAGLGAPPAGAHLEVYKDGRVVEYVDLSIGLSRYALGRDAGSCEIALEHPSCSRRHAEIERAADGGLSVMDLGSAQGTFLDGAPKPLAARARTALRHGSRLEFGASTRSFVVRLPAAAAQRAEAAAPPPLSADAKKKRLWGGGAAKRDRAGTSEAARDREAANLERWGAAAGALGGGDGRSDKFLALMGAKKRKVDAPSSTAAAAAERQSAIHAALERDFDRARSRGFGRRGLG